MGLVVLLALSFTTVKKLAQKSKEPSSADAGLCIATAMSFRPLWQCMCKGTRFVLFPFNTSCRCKTKSQQTAQLARRFFTQKHHSTQHSRERTAPRISSWTSLKCYIHFSFILKLAVFIYKQLKRPVAFSAVHQSHKRHLVFCCKSGQVVFSWKEFQLFPLFLPFWPSCWFPSSLDAKEEARLSNAFKFVAFALILLLWF